MENKNIPEVSGQKLSSIQGDFDFHVDPKYFGFQWQEAMYIHIVYSAIKEGDKVISSIDCIAAEPWLIGSIVTHGYWMEVSKETIAAAQDHAEKQFKSELHPIFQQALSPFI